MRQYGEGRAALTLLGIARALRFLDRYEAAESYYRQALQALRSLSDRIGVVNALDGLGLTYSAMGMPDHARTAYGEALDELQYLAAYPGHARLLSMVGEHLAQA
jgi:tetratricopeptide (TPR) repeat protein